MPSRCIDRPNPRQAEFLTATNRYIGYGGSRGGGKSWAVRKKAMLLALNYAGIKLLILRRSYPELRENHILPMMRDLMGIAAYRDSDKSFTFPNGSRIKFGYCDNDNDLLRYQGNEYDVIFIDEATQIPEAWVGVFAACIRGANDFPKRMYITCNPGGVGHEWVKRLFIDRRFRGSENPDDYIFIPARVYDNKALTDQDTGYISMLQNLPDGLRRAWLDGDWDVFQGQYFTGWRRDIHVIDPHPIPEHWRRYVTMDYGLDMLAVYWIAVDTQGRAEVYRELYEGRDLGPGHDGLLVSDAIWRIKDMCGEKIYAWYAPPDLWNRKSDTGKSTAEWFLEAGIPIQKAQNDRVMGWMELKEWLKPVKAEDGGTTANLRVFNTCPNLIRTLPALQYDTKDTNDCATNPHEITHGPDAIRYFVAGRPIPGSVPVDMDHDTVKYEDQVEDMMGYGG